MLVKRGTATGIAVRCDARRFDAVRCGAVRCGAVRCEVSDVRRWRGGGPLPSVKKGPKGCIASLLLLAGSQRGNRFSLSPEDWCDLTWQHKALHFNSGVHAFSSQQGIFCVESSSSHQRTPEISFRNGSDRTGMFSVVLRVLNMAHGWVSRRVLVS
jgi:hypothetical protein